MDLVIETTLRDPACASLSDPLAFVAFLRDAFEPARCEVTHVVGGDETGADEADRRFSTLCDQLAGGLPPLARDDAVRIALRADELCALRDPFDRPGFSIDVGVHARQASSFARKGRILAAIARFARARSALEIGTAYGMSALFLAAELSRRDGTLVTLERSHPQIDIATRILAAEHPDTVRVLGGISAEVEAQLGGARFDLLFHDAAHSYDAYVNDLDAFVDRLDPGAVVVYDDIRWDDPHRSAPARTYEGWQQVTRHPRVRQAIEIDALHGALLLR